jgi:HlyD family secretion protein
MKTILSSLAAVGIAAFGLAYYAGHKAKEPPSPPIVAPAEKPAPVAKVERKVPPSPITATGTVRPDEVVEVGAQVNGMIAAFGPDPNDPNKPVDYGSVVRKGSVLARIDPTVYQAQVNYAEASLMKAKADLTQFLARCNQMKQEWTRAKSLAAKKAIADSEFDQIAANFEMATGSVQSGEATVKQCEAALQQSKAYLSYTVITSPIDGVVIERRVNVGQIVCASFNVPGLFLVAKDLARTQVWASIDENDIGRIREGLPSVFTFDAFPGKVFKGKVSQVRVNATKTNNRANYTVVVAPEDCCGLLPYLTAKLQFDVADQAGLQPIAATRQPQ